MIRSYSRAVYAAHTVHLPAPALLNVPAAQGWHAGWPIMEYEPA